MLIFPFNTTLSEKLGITRFVSGLFISDSSGELCKSAKSFDGEIITRFVHTQNFPKNYHF